VPPASGHEVEKELGYFLTNTAHALPLVPLARPVHRLRRSRSELQDGLRLPKVSPLANEEETRSGGLIGQAPRSDTSH
jgi:hypothetical protein